MEWVAKAVSKVAVVRSPLLAQVVAGMVGGPGPVAAKGVDNQRHNTAPRLWCHSRLVERVP